MKYTEHEINAAINAAENLAHPMAADNASITVENKTLLVLVYAAQQNLERVNELEDELKDIRQTLRNL